MHPHLTATTTAAMLLAATTAHYALFGVGTARRVVSAPEPARAVLPLGRIGHMALERCAEHVEIIQDVHWAAACMITAREEQARRTACLRRQLAPAGQPAGDPCDADAEAPDDSAECTLPPNRAAVLEAGRKAAHRRCRAEAAEIEHMAEGPRTGR